MFNFRFSFNNFGGRLLGITGFYLLFSMFFGALVWALSFFVIIKQFSWLAVFFIFMIKAVPFVAALILLINHQWAWFALVAIGVSLEYFMRFYMARLINRKTKSQEADSHVIDVNSDDVIDV